MIRPYLDNPLQTAALLALLGAGRWTPWAFAAASLFFAACEIEAGLRGRPAPRWWPSLWPAAAGPVSILYDATCNLCLGSKKRLESWRSAGSMRFVPIQSPEAKALAPGLTEEALLGAMHVVEEGRVWSGAEGWFRLMGLAPLPLGLAAWIIPGWIARPVYAWVARNRYKWFGRRCEGGTCSIHPTASGDKPSSSPSGSPGPSSPGP